MVLPIDFDTIKNLLLEHKFNLETLNNGLGAFQYVDSIEKLELTESECIPQKIFDYAPEKSIISIDTPASAEYPRNEAGHLWVLTGEVTNNWSRAIPMFCVWVCSGSNEIYFAYYNGEGDDFKWYLCNTATATPVQTITYEGVSFKYRIILGNILEFEVTTQGTRYPTQTQIGTIPYSPKLDNAYFPLIKWENSGVYSGINGIRFTTTGQVQIICVDNYLHGHGFMGIK